MSEHVHSHDCKVLLGSLSEYIDGELRADLCALIEEHVKDCENCRIVIDTLRKTVEIYEHTAPPAELPRVTGDVEERRAVGRKRPVVAGLHGDAAHAPLDSVEGDADWSGRGRGGRGVEKFRHV